MPAGSGSLSGSAGSVPSLSRFTMSSSTGSGFSLFSILVDLLYYSCYYLYSLFPFPNTLQRRKEKERERTAIREKLLSALSGPISTCTAPAISIIIPSYNEENHIENTLLAALAAGSGQIEIIVADGGSKDGTRGVCEKYADHGVRCVQGGSCRAECQNTGECECYTLAFI